MNEHTKHIGMLKTEQQVEQGVFTMPAQRHCDLSSIFFSNELRNTVSNSQGEVSFHESTLGLTTGGENVLHLNQNDYFFNENTDWVNKNNNTSMRNNLEGEHNCDSNLFWSRSLNSHREDPGVHICTENEALSSQGRIQSTAEQEEGEMLFVSELLTFGPLNGREAMEVSSKSHQSSQSRVSTPHETPCKAHEVIHGAEAVVETSEQCLDNALSAQRMICKRILEDFLGSTSSEHKERHATQLHHALKQQQPTLVSFPTTANPFNLQQTQFVPLSAPPPSSSLPLYNQIASQPTPPLAGHSVPKATAAACADGTFSANGAVSSKPLVPQSYRALTHDTKNEPPNQPGENAAHSMSGDASSHLPGHLPSNGAHDFTYHNGNSGVNYQVPTTNTLAAPPNDHTGPFMLPQTHPYLSCTTGAETDPRNAMFYTPREITNGHHPVSGVSTKTNSNFNVGEPSPNASDMTTALRVVSNLGNVLTDHNNSQQGVPSQMASSVARSKMWAAEKPVMMTIPLNNLSSQSAKNAESPGAGTYAFVTMPPSTPSQAPFCNVVPQQNYFILPAQPQAPYSVPNMINPTMMTAVNNGCQLMLSTPLPSGSVYYANFSENHPHPRHGGETATLHGMPRECLVAPPPPPPALYDVAPPSTTPVVSSMNFTPVSPYTTLSFAPKCLLLPSAPASAGGRSVSATTVDANPGDAAAAPPDATPPPGSPPRPQLLMLSSPSSAGLHRKYVNVHGRLYGVARYIPYVENAPPAPTISININIDPPPLTSLIHSLSPAIGGGAMSSCEGRLPPPPPPPPLMRLNTGEGDAHGQPEMLSIFFQMFPCELQDRKSFINRVIAATCGPDVATVTSVEPRSETSFIALVRTRRGNYLVHRLRCRVLMDRHGFWYAEDMKQYMFLKVYCEAIRRLPQQSRHLQTEGLPCMPLVVEFSRTLGRDCVPSDPAPACFDALVPIATVDRHRSRHTVRMGSNNGNNSSTKHHNRSNASGAHNSLS